MPALFLNIRALLLSLTVIGLVALLPGFVAAQGDDDSQNAIAIFNQAQDFHEKGDFAQAIVFYEKALKMMPEFPEAEYQRGIAELAIGNSAEAEKSFRRAVDLRPEWTLALAKLGESLVKDLIDSPVPTQAAVSQALFIEATGVLSKALELDPNNFPAAVALVDLRLHSSSTKEVLTETLEKIRSLTVGKSNTPASVWAARAALETRLGNQAAAKSSLLTALSIEPLNKAALFQVADIAIVEGDIAKAKEIAARLETISSNSDALHLLKASLLAQDGIAVEALKQLDMIAHQSTASAELRKRITASSAQNPADLEKQLASSPRDPVLLGRLCTLYRREDPAKALVVCRQAVEAEPGNINHAIGFAAALVQARQFDSAVTVLRRIIGIAPDNSTVHANLATALFELKKYPEAKVEYEWLTNAQPKSAAAYFFLGIVHDQMGEFMDAMANYQQYLRLADPVVNKLEIDKVNLRMPALQRQIKEGKGKKNG